MLARCRLCGDAAFQELYSPPRNVGVASDCRPWPRTAPVFLCAACGHAQKRTTADDLAAIYADYELNRLSGGVEQLLFDASGAVTRSDRILDRLEKVRPPAEKGRMLDVGCGNGATLRAFGRRRPAWDLYGMEQGDRRRDEILALPGVKGFWSGSLEEVEGPFDLVTVVHVLEHVPEPPAFLRRARELLKPDGLLLIQVPDATANAFDFLVADHCSHFAAERLKVLVEEAGFEPAALATDWVAKETTCLALPGAGVRASAVEVGALAERARAGARWLAGIPGDAARRAAEAKGRFGVFGTAIAGTWLGAVLEDRVACYVDEDARRVGKRHWGKPVVGPAELAAGDVAYLAFPAPIALALRERLSRVSRADFAVPPA